MHLQILLKSKSFLHQGKIQGSLCDTHMNLGEINLAKLHQTVILLLPNIFVPENRPNCQDSLSTVNNSLNSH